MVTLTNPQLPEFSYVGVAASNEAQSTTADPVSITHSWKHPNPSHAEWYRLQLRILDTEPFGDALHNAGDRPELRRLREDTLGNLERCFVHGSEACRTGGWT